MAGLSKKVGNSDIMKWESIAKEEDDDDDVDAIIRYIAKIKYKRVKNIKL